MTDLERYLAETERRWRERTPATRIDEVNASYRVGRGEMRRWCSETGVVIDEMDEVVEVALLRLYIRLRREFPTDRWDHYNNRIKELAKRESIVLPRTRKV